MLAGVAGPSDAGKDNLLTGARAALAAEPRLRWVRRAITRPAEAGGEAHEALDATGFVARRDAGGFALWWEAHGLVYCLPRDIDSDIAAGRIAVANLSRGALLEAAARYPPKVLNITAAPALRAQRLAARGCERAEEIAARLAREAPLPPGLKVAKVVNDGTLEEGVARVAALLRDWLSRAA